MPKALLDCDAFFASCEQARNPSLLGQPILISGQPGTRSVVSSASYPAKHKGVKAGMSPEEALKLCPDARIVSGDFSYYISVHRVMEHRLISLGLDVESSSIDEFYVDLPGSYAEARMVLFDYQGWVERNLGLTVSIGIAPTKLLAKLASELVKPKGLSVLLPEALPHCLDELGVQRLLGIGNATASLLAGSGIKTLGQLRNAPEQVLSQLGMNRAVVGALLSGSCDEGKLVTESPPKSVSCRMTLPYDIDDSSLLEHCIFFLADHVSSRMRKHGMCARAVSIILRYPDFSTAQKTKTLERNLYSGFEAAEHAISLFRSFKTDRRKVRLIGLCLSGLQDWGRSGIDIPILPPDRKRHELTNTLDRLRKRFGETSVSFASSNAVLGKHPRKGCS